jgi:hypothetical protein
MGAALGGAGEARRRGTHSAAGRGAGLSLNGRGENPYDAAQVEQLGGQGVGAGGIEPRGAVAGGGRDPGLYDERGRHHDPARTGLEVRIPAHAALRDENGRPVTEVSIAPIPLDRPPFPLPANVEVPPVFHGPARRSVYQHTVRFRGASRLPVPVTNLIRGRA